MQELILEFIINNQGAASFLVVVGLLRAVFKPIFAVVQAYVDHTPDKEDNEKLEKLKANRYYKMLVFILDYVTSIKLPKK